MLHQIARRPMTLRAVAAACLIAVAGCGPRLAAGPADAPRYVVFFTAYSGNIDTPARGVITEAAEAARGQTSAVVVAGYADSVGTPETNVTLSRLRAQNVADELVADGVDRARIVLRPRGQVAGDQGLESRRVEIQLTR
jgi:outer membrane protein OmpA-like peptidoglycan-associated protein